MIYKTYTWILLTGILLTACDKPQPPITNFPKEEDQLLITDATQETASQDKSTTSDDQAINQKLRNAINTQYASSAPNITISTNKGHVTLNGTIGTLQEKIAIERTSRHIKGVKVVENHLEVKKMAKK